MKSKLKNNDGMALAMVLVLIAILSFMGTAMYAYSMQSLDVAKWGTNRKKAEYIARAGIEATAYAYQDTEYTSGSSGTTEANDDAKTYAAEFIAAGKNKKTDYSIGAGKNGDAVSVYVKKTDGTVVPYSETDADNPVIYTNWIYVCQYDSSYNDDLSLKKSGVVYIDGGTGDEPSGISRKYIGYFRVQVIDDPRAVHVNADCTDGASCTNTDHYTIQEFKKFISKGYVNGKIATRTASIVTTDYQNNWIDENGLITMGGVDEKGKPLDSNVAYIGNMVLNYPKFLNITPSPSNLKIIAGHVVGNLVVNNPSDNPMHFATENKSHGVAFIGMNNLFMETAIDVTPSKKTTSVGGAISDAWDAFKEGFINSEWGSKFSGGLAGAGASAEDANSPSVSAVYLSGNNIVVHGDINLYAFYFSQKWYDQVWDTISGSYTLNKKMGTVIINVPSSVQTTVDDPLPKSSGGLGQCGKIYFDGNVYVTIGRRNSKSSTYKAFSAGDVYYFNANFKSTNTATSSTGIDLLKYFLDTAIASNKYSATVTQQFTDVRNFWYIQGGNFTANYADDVNMRKINPKNDVDSITDLLPPSTSDAAYIIWE